MDAMGLKMSPCISLGRCPRRTVPALQAQVSELRDTHIAGTANLGQQIIQLQIILRDRMDAIIEMEDTGFP